ncbi:MAG: cyclic nucleotide-binding domain-containing protein [Gaiellaceae bacterium]
MISEPARPLAEMPLFAGIGDRELHGIEQVVQRVNRQPGELLFRQGEEADGLHVVVAGVVGVYRRLPAAREVELARLGPGEVFGELALVDGGRRAATVRALEPTSTLFLGRADFLALVSRMAPSAFTIKRRVAAVVCDRLRRRYTSLSDSLGGDGRATTQVDAAPGELVPAGAPGDAYLARLPFFRGFAQPLRAELVGLCRTLHVPPRRVVLREAAQPEAAFVTLNGAVEELLGSGRRRIRVRLAGPGSAVAYVGILDGGPSPVTVATRERALLLAVPRATFTELFEGATPLSHAFVEAVEHDLVAALRQAELPQARLAVSS